MSKYIIEIPDDVQYVLLNGQTDNKCYTAVRPVAELEELNSDYINENFGELQEEAYQAGLNDAWKAAKKIVVDTDRGGFTLDALREIFGTQGFFCIMQDNTAQQAIDKIKAYEDKHSDRIEVGDEVIYNGTTKCLVIVPETDKRYASLLDCKGIHYSADHRECKKTGKHYDIASILEAMRE